MKRIVLLAAASILVLSTIITARPATAHPLPPNNNPCVAAIRRVFPANQQARAIAISFRESRWTQTAVNPRRTKLGNAQGCMQVLSGVARNVGARCNQLEAMCNVLTARNLQKRAGWRPWATR